MNRLKCIFAAVFAAVVFASCANMFQKKVEMTENDSSSSLFDLLIKNEVEEQLCAPEEIFVSLYDYSDKIKISWTPVKNAAYYRLERAVVSKDKVKGNFTPEENEYEILEHTSYVFATSYTDIIISDTALDYTNEQYDCVFFYRVSAENPQDGFEPSSFKVSTMATLLAPPTNVKAKDGSENPDYIEIEWGNVRGAARYEIYRSSYTDGANSIRVGNVITNINAKTMSYRDESAAAFPGQNLYYTVRSVAENGEKSVSSSVGYGYTLMPGAPSRVSGVKIVSENPIPSGGVEISWDPVSISLLTGQKLVYTVYRSSSSDSFAEEIKEVDFSITSCEDTGPKRGFKANTYYYYQVKATVIETEGDVETRNSGPMSLSGKDSENPAFAFPLSPSPSVSVSINPLNSSQCIIKVAPAIGDVNYVSKDAQHECNMWYDYEVLCDNSLNGGFTTKVDTISSINDTFKDGYYLKSVEAKSYYKIRTKNVEDSSELTSVIAPAPRKAENVWVTRAAAIPGYTDDIVMQGNKVISEPKANNLGVHAVKITWQAPEGGAEGGYHIYRSDNIDTGYKKITANPIYELSYIDAYDGAKAGKIYYYKILSLNLLLQGDNYSDVDAPTLIDIINTSGENVNKKWTSPNKPEYAGKAKIIDVTKGRGFGWGALTIWQYMQEQRKTVVTSQAKLTIMHKPSSTDKIGKESINGDICGTLAYDSHIQGFGGRVIMPYTDYADLFIQDDPSLGVYFFFDNGNTNTTADMSANGNMDGYITHFGMYPGWVRYDNVVIKGGAAGGGTYGVIRKGIDADNGDDQSKLIEVDWQAGN